jgi:hypothetical protein
VVLPTLDIPGVKERYAGLAHVEESIYSSSEDLMDKAEIRAMLARGGFL